MEMATNVTGLPRGWSIIVRDSSGNVALFNFYGALQQQKFVVRLLNDVCSDFADTNCIIVS